MPSDGNALTGRHARFALASPPRRRLLVAAFVAACIASLSIISPAIAAAPGDRPGIFLEGASVPRAKGLALDAALIKGWHVVETERNHVIFETILEEPASIGPPNAVAPDYTLLRIRADFVETPAGVNAYLYAEEIWYAGSSKEWSTDVTPQYRANLTNALSSLQSQWEKTARTRPNAAPSGPAQRHDERTRRGRPGTSHSNHSAQGPRRADGHVQRGTSSTRPSSTTPPATDPTNQRRCRGWHMGLPRGGVRRRTRLHTERDRRRAHFQRQRQRIAPSALPRRQQPARPLRSRNLRRRALECTARIKQIRRSRPMDSRRAVRRTAAQNGRPRRTTGADQRLTSWP